MEHRHFRTLLSAFLQPYCLSSPLPLFASHVAPILIPVLVHGAKRISEAWAGWESGDESGVSSASGDGSGGSGGSGSGGSGSVSGSGRLVNPCHMPLGVPSSSMEMVQEKIIRDLSRDMAMTVSALIPPKPAHRNAKGKIIKQKGKQAGQVGFYISPLAQLMLNDLSKDGAAEVVLRTLAMAASWPDSITLGVVVKVVERILPVVASISSYFPFVGGTLLTSLLRALLSEEPYSKENQHGLIHIIALIYCSISLGIRPVEQGGGGHAHPGQHNSDVALRVFASLPGATEQKVAAMNQALVSEKSTKQRRMLVQEFLQGCAASNKLPGGGGSRAVDSVLRAKFQNYLNLPEPVIDLKKQAEAHREAFEKASGSQPLSNLFG